MENKHSADSIAEDMIRAFQQLVCAEGHLKTLLEKKTAELENGIVDTDDSEEVAIALEQLDNYQEELTSVAQLRRNMMVTLYEMFEGDKTYWCQVKHLASAAYTAFEAYQASDTESQHGATLLNMALEINKQFIRALTHFLGTEITTCASCFGDFLKGEKESEEDDMADLYEQ